MTEQLKTLWVNFSKWFTANIWNSHKFWYLLSGVQLGFAILNAQVGSFLLMVISLAVSFWSLSIARREFHKFQLNFLNWVGDELEKRIKEEIELNREP